MSAPENITTIHVLSFLYCFFSHMDGEFSDEEKETMIATLAQWDPDLENILTGSIEGTKWFLSTLSEGSTTEQVLEIIDVLSELSTEVKQAIIDDLINLAEADGKYDDAEKTMVGHIKEAFGL